MRYEVEQKFRVADLSAIEQQLKQLAAVEHEAVVQVDRYFQHPARNFAETDEALRIRSVGDQNLITYKGPKIDTTTKTRRELELPLGPGGSTLEQFSELLEALGFRQVREVIKMRRPFAIRYQDTDIEGSIDVVDGLGTFVEIELLADQRELAAATQRILSLAARLNLDLPERRSYLEMLIECEGAASNE